MQFGKKNNYKTYLYSRPVIAFFVIVVVMLCISVFERYGVERDMSARRAASETELERLQARKLQLEDRVDYLEGERGIEEEIRKNFDVAREGEQVIIMVGDAPTAPIAEIDSAVKEKYWYQFWR